MPELEDWERLDRLEHEENMKLLRRVVRLVMEGYYDTVARDLLARILRTCTTADGPLPEAIAAMPDRDCTGVHEEWIHAALNYFISAELRRLESRRGHLLRRRKAVHG